MSELFDILADYGRKTSYKFSLGLMYSNFMRHIINYDRIINIYYTTILSQCVDKYKHKYDIYDTILKSLNDYQIRKRQFMKIEFEKCIKYCDYAEEQCVVQEKLLLSILQMNKYSNELNIIIETIIMEPIQKHIYCINTDTIIAYPSFVKQMDDDASEYCVFDLVSTWTNN